MIELGLFLPLLTMADAGGVLELLVPPSQSSGSDHLSLLN